MSVFLHTHGDSPKERRSCTGAPLRIQAYSIGSRRLLRFSDTLREVQPGGFFFTTEELSPLTRSLYPGSSLVGDLLCPFRSQIE